MAKIVIAGICSCPRFAMVEYVAEHLKDALPNFQLHKIVLDEGEPWEHWLNDVCVRNGWLHDQSPIVWRELLERGSKGILIGNADDFLEYAKTYYGVHLTIPTEYLLRIGQENYRLHSEQTLRNQVSRDLMQAYTVGCFAACHRVALMILFQIVRDGTLGHTKTLILKLFCHTTHGDILTSIKNDLLDLASPYLRRVIIAEDMETAVKGCDLIIWLEDPFCVSKAVISYSADSSQIILASSQSRPKPNGEDTITVDITRLPVAASWPLSDTSAVYPFTRAHRPESNPSYSTGAYSSSSESFLQLMDLHNLSGGSSEVILQKKSASLEEHTLASDKKLLFSSSVDDYSSTSKRPSLSVEEHQSVRKSPEQSPKTSTKKSSSATEGIFSEIDLRIRSHAEVIGRSVHPECKVVMAGDDPCLNYCAYILVHTCPFLASSLIVVCDLEIRTRGALARKMGVRPSDVQDVFIWGDPGNDFTIDLSRATVSNYDGAVWKEKGYSCRLESIFHHWKWFKRDLKPELREQSCYRPNGKCYASAMTLSCSVVTSLKRWYSDYPTPLTSVGVVSDGSYGIPRGQVMTCPVYLHKGTWYSASLDMSDYMLHKLGRLVNKCFENQLLYLRKLKREIMANEE